MLELVRYIHLNPIQAGLVKDLKSLAKYDKSGHAVIMGKYKYSWQDTRYVLRGFGKTLRAARRSYAAYVTKGKCIYRGQSNELSKKFERDLFGW